MTQAKLYARKSHIVGQKTLHWKISGKCSESCVMNKLQEQLLCNQWLEMQACHGFGGKMEMQVRKVLLSTKLRTYQSEWCFHQLSMAQRAILQPYLVALWVTAAGVIFLGYVLPNVKHVRTRTGVPPVHG